MLWARFSKRRSARLHYFEHGAAWYRLTIKTKCGVVVYTRRLVLPPSGDVPLSDHCQHCLAVITSEESRK